ncbi:thioredoxin domain-containing protein 9 [Condylostylus longicornis]|uniref:thioredoxin domain-containing protein 9 n=1 Tax=Condylostylus longicornis TaxID=2530218 RepID=UPI00244E2032|nr:thioredoxin domain-containing protein 9 [Condylostylus longicornis]XP_055375330.1 thioredoxin domain-containing protein 9 [Condylostylus longicornis]
MEKVFEQTLISAAQQVEKQIDSQLEQLDNLDSDDLQKIREERLKQMKELNKKKQEWLNNGHGVYSELADEKEFFEVSKKSPNIVCHFYKDSTERCKIVDKHLKILAAKHVEAKFCKVNAEKSPFLTQRLRIKIIPTIALVKDSKTKDYIVGFTDLGNCDDFPTEMMEWRIAQSGAIDYNGDLLCPPDQNRKPKNYFNRPKKAIRGGYDSDDSDFDFDD